MANYTKKFTRPYANGYKDRPDTSTPVTANIKNAETNALLAIEEYLSQNDITPVSIDGLLNNGYSIAIIEIDGETYDLNIPELSYESAITGGTKIGKITLGEKSYDLYAPAASTGGSNVAVAPKVTSGTNIATIVVDGKEYQLYAPTGSGSGSTVTAEATLTQGTEIGKIVVDGKETILYAPTGRSIQEIYIGDDPESAPDSCTLFVDTSEDYDGSGSTNGGNAFELTPVFLGVDYVEQTTYNDTQISVSITLSEDCTDIFFVAGMTDGDNNYDNYFQDVIADNVMMMETKRTFQSTAQSNPFTDYLKLFSNLLNAPEILNIPQPAQYYAFAWKYYLKEGKAGTTYTFTKQRYGKDVFVFAYALNRNGEMLKLKVLA